MFWLPSSCVGWNIFDLLSVWRKRQKFCSPFFRVVLRSQHKAFAVLIRAQVHTYSRAFDSLHQLDHDETICKETEHWQFRLWRLTACLSMTLKLSTNQSTQASHIFFRVELSASALGRRTTTRKNNFAISFTTSFVCFLHSVWWRKWIWRLSVDQCFARNQITSRRMCANDCCNEAISERCGYCAVRNIEPSHNNTSEQSTCEIPFIHNTRFAEAHKTKLIPFSIMPSSSLPFLVCFIHLVVTAAAAVFVDDDFRGTVCCRFTLIRN